MLRYILAAFILYLPFQLKMPQFPLVNTTNLFLIILLLILILKRMPNRTALSIEIPLILFLILWSSSFVHTLLYPPGPWKYEVAVSFKRLISLVLVYFIFSRCVNTDKELKFLFYAVLLSLILVGLHTWRGGVLAGPHFADFKRSSGPFALDWRGSDIAGGFLATFTPFLLSFTLLINKKILKLTGFIGIMVCSLGLFTTYSRGSILAFGIASVLCIMLSAKQILRTSKITAIIIFVAFLGIAFNWQKWVPQSIIHRIQGTTVQEETYGGELPLDESSQKRIAKWQEGLEIFKSNQLFGVGFRIPEFVIGTDTHNSFVQIAAEMGIFGFLVFAWFLFSILLKAKSLLKSEFDWLGIGFIGCIISFICVNMFYSNFFRDTVVGTFWVLLGLLVSAKKISEATT